MVSKKQAVFFQVKEFQVRDEDPTPWFVEDAP